MIKLQRTISSTNIRALATMFVRVDVTNSRSIFVLRRLLHIASLQL